MGRIARSIGHELTETEDQTKALNESLERSAKREGIARELAEARYGSDDVVVEPPDEQVEYVDGGYWVRARIWIDADEVEERMGP